MICEKCGEKEAGYFTTPYGNNETGKVWAATCSECDTDEYWILIEEYFNPSCRWPQHLRMKRWFDQEPFDRLLERYSEQKDSTEIQDGTDYC